MSYIDLALSDALLADVFRYRGVPEPIDQGSTRLRPICCCITYGHTAPQRGAAAAGDPSSAADHSARAELWAELVR